MKHTKPHLDPYQFAYKHNRSTEDATLILLHNAYIHLENPGSFDRILIDFSSAFNTIQPHLMASEPLKIYVNTRLILWTVDFLVNRSQTVRHQDVLSSSRSISTGSPQGTVPSPILFTHYTNVCTGTDTTQIIKCSDDPAPTVIPDLFIDGVKVERVTEYKYLRTVLDNKLNFNKNTDFTHKRCQPRIFCLQKLRSLDVSAAVLRTFYRTCIESVLTFSFLCWFLSQA